MDGAVDIYVDRRGLAIQSDRTFGNVGLGSGEGLADGRGLGFGFADDLALGLGDGDADGDGIGNVGMTVNVGIGDCGATGVWASLPRECAAAIAERRSVPERPMAATLRRQCDVNMIP